MKCEEVREQFIETLPAGAKSPEAVSHLAKCEECAAALKSLASAMAILDEWQAPEPSPYFQTRFRARLAELKAEDESRPAWQSAFDWLRKPAFGMPVWRPMMAGALALAMAIGVGLMQNGDRNSSGVARFVQAPQGTAVGDLQILERNQEMFSDFDVLDDLPATNGAQVQNVNEVL